MRLCECLVCGEQVNDYPDDKCQRCRKDVAEQNRIQWEPSKTAAPSLKVTRPISMASMGSSTVNAAAMAAANSIDP